MLNNCHFGHYYKMRYKRIRYLDRFILYDFIRNLIIFYFLIPRSPNFKAHKLKKCQWKAILILPLVHSVYIKQSIHTKLHRYSEDGDTSTTIILCRAHAGASGRYVPGTCGRIGSTLYRVKTLGHAHFDDVLSPAFIVVSDSLLVLIHLCD